MKFSVDWTSFMNVNSEHKCSRVIANISERLGVQLVDIKTERYLKEKALFKARGKARLEAPSAKDVYYLVMKKASRLARVRIATVPDEDDSWEFGGTTQPGSLNLQGVDSICFTASYIKATTPTLR